MLDTRRPNGAWRSAGRFWILYEPAVKFPGAAPLRVGFKILRGVYGVTEKRSAAPHIAGNPYVRI